MVGKKSKHGHSRNEQKPAKIGMNVFSGMRMPSEVRIVGVLVLLLAALYVFQLISQPSFLKSQAKGITGLVVADTGNGATTSPAQQAAAPENAQKEPALQKPQAAPQPAPVTDPIKITSPKKGSTVSPGFNVDVEVSEHVLTCYYLVKDNGAVTWDRRTKPCKTTVTVAPDFCKTAGENTCYVYAEAADGNGNIIGSDTAYYSIR